MKKNKQAAALKYELGIDNAPRVIASGKGYIAEKIIEISKKNGIPVVQDEKTADMLCSLPVDSEIPEMLYQAAAEILAFVLQMDCTHGVHK